jgi:hypothetical protein
MLYPLSYKRRELHFKVCAFEVYSRKLGQISGMKGRLKVSLESLGLHLDYVQPQFPGALSVPKVAIACPKGAKTGGPEALHQLCRAIQDLGIDAFLVDTGNSNSEVDEYKKYGVRWKSFEELKWADFLIVPETLSTLPGSWIEVFSGKVVLWWLSVDNSSYCDARHFESKTHPLPEQWQTVPSMLEQIKGVFARLLESGKTFAQLMVSGHRDQTQIPLFPQSCLHIAQSIYAQDWVAKHLGARPFLVSDYIWAIPSKSAGGQNFTRFDNRKEVAIVAYNPAKGGDLVRLVQKFSRKDIEFVPLKGMSGGEISDWLRVADLYLDLGHFPGRDRMPREAALANCPVLLARRGSARHFGDFPISNDYLMSLDVESPQSVAARIDDMLKQRDSALSNQKMFANTVKKSKQNFDSEVKAWVQNLFPFTKEVS